MNLKLPAREIKTKVLNRRMGTRRRVTVLRRLTIPWMMTSLKLGHTLLLMLLINKASQRQGRRRIIQIRKTKARIVISKMTRQIRKQKIRLRIQMIQVIMLKISQTKMK